MKSVVLFVVVVALFWSCQGQSRDEILSQQLNKIYSDNRLMGLSLGIVNEKNEIIYFNTQGYQQYQTVNTTQNTYYRVASISKTVTTLALMKLVDQGKVTMEDDISIHLGYRVRNPRFLDTPITVGQILSHTSSIREGTTYDDFLMYTYNQNNPANIPNMSELLLPGGKWYSSTLFATQPVGYFTYCNLNFGIAGTIIEKVSGLRFDIFVRENILLPLNITGSFNVADIQNWTDIATIYIGENGGWKANHDDYTSKPPQRNMSGYIPGLNGLVYGPQGGCVIRLKELTQILGVLSNNGTLNGVTIISKYATYLMTSFVWKYNGTNGDPMGGEMRGYGEGVHISTDTKDEDVVWPGYLMRGHTGFAYGLASNMWYNPVDKQGFVFATNGALNGYKGSPTSGFILLEQQVMLATYDYLYKQNQTQTIELVA